MVVSLKHDALNLYCGIQLLVGKELLAHLRDQCTLSNIRNLGSSLFVAVIQVKKTRNG